MMVLSNEEFSDYLAHHGILGQKWGIRRYQNADGSLTDAGRKRYSGVIGKVRMIKDYSSERKKIKTRKKNLEKARKAREDKKKAQAELEEQKKEWAKSPSQMRKHLDAFSDDEIKQALDRFNNDKKLAVLEQEKIDRGIKYIKMIGDVANTTTSVINMFGAIEEVRKKTATADNLEATANKNKIEEKKAEEQSKLDLKVAKEKQKNELQQVKNEAAENKKKHQEAMKALESDSDQSNKPSNGNNSNKTSDKPSSSNEPKKPSPAVDAANKVNNTIKTALKKPFTIDKEGLKNGMNKVGSSLQNEFNDTKSMASAMANVMKADVKDTMSGVSNTVNAIGKTIYKKYNGYSVDWIDVDD